MTARKGTGNYVQPDDTMAPPEYVVYVQWVEVGRRTNEGAARKLLYERVVLGQPPVSLCGSVPPYWEVAPCPQ